MTIFLDVAKKIFPNLILARSFVSYEAPYNDLGYD
jgi:hypothetical protein